MNKYYIIKLNNNIRGKSRWEEPDDTSVLTDIIEKQHYIEEVKGIFRTRTRCKYYDPVDIICENIDGKMYDLITGDLILFAPSLESVNYNCLTYNSVEEIPKELVVNQLKEYKKCDIKRYKEAIDEIKAYTLKCYNKQQRINQKKIEERKKLEQYAKEADSYISEFKKKYRK